MKLFELKILTLFVTSLILSSCASPSRGEKFDGRWRFSHGDEMDEVMICLPKSDIKKLKRILIQCKKK